MAKVPLDAMTLNLLSDGYSGKVIDHGLSEVVRDLVDRGHDGKPRKLVVTFALTLEGEGRVSIDTQVKTQVPAYRPPATQAKFDRAAGGLVFNPEVATNPDQQTFADADAGN